MFASHEESVAPQFAQNAAVEGLEKPHRGHAVVLAAGSTVASREGGGGGVAGGGATAGGARPGGGSGWPPAAGGGTAPRRGGRPAGTRCLVFRTVQRDTPYPT